MVTMAGLHRVQQALVRNPSAFTQLTIEDAKTKEQENGRHLAQLLAPSCCGCRQIGGSSGSKAIKMLESLKATM